MLERLQKIISRSGIASKRHAEELISGGQVRVNGEVVTLLGSKADPEKDRIEVAGKVAEIPTETSYYMLHKPVNVVATMSDPEGRGSLRHLLRGLTGVFPIGRLDYAASGMLLLTNDGELANRLFRISARMPKLYWMKIKGRPDADLLAKLRHTAHAHLRLLDAPDAAKKDADNPWYEVELAEARRDILRTALFAADHPVEKMKRVKIGPLHLGDLPEAHYRKLDPDEVTKLRQAIERAEKAPAPVRMAGKRKDPGNFRYKQLREAKLERIASFNAEAAMPSPSRSSPPQYQQPFDETAYSPAAAAGESASFAPSKPRLPRTPFDKSFEQPQAERPPRPSGNRPFQKSFSKPFGKPREGRSSRPSGDRPFRKPFTKSFGKPGEGGSSRPSGDHPFRKPFTKSFGKPGEGGSSRPSGDRPFRKPFTKSFGKPGEGGSSRPSGDRPFRKPFTKSFGKPGEGGSSRPSGDRPFRKPFTKSFGKPGEGGSSRPSGDRPFRKPFTKSFGKPGEGDSSRPSGDRPFRKSFSKPFGKPGEGVSSRPSGDRPFRKPFSKPGEGRPSRPFGDRPSSDRPSGDRPFRKSFDKPFRKSGSGGSSSKPSGGKPFRKSFGKSGGDFKRRPPQ